MQSQENERFEIPTWDQIYEMLLDLAQKIREGKFKPDIIVGVSRGGWAPTRVLSDLLEHPYIANIRAEFYVGVAETKKEPVITQCVSASVKGKNVLVVDDVSDTGKSLQAIKSHLLQRGAKAFRIAALYYKPWSVTRPDYYEKTTRKWVIFPWERKEAFRKVMEKFRKNGKSVEEAKQTLIRHGFDSKLAERFIKEMSEASG